MRRRHMTGIAAAAALLLMLSVGMTALAANQTTYPTAVITAQKLFQVDNAVNLGKLDSAVFVLKPDSVISNLTGVSYTKATEPMPQTGVTGSGDARQAEVTIAAVDFTAAGDGLSKTGSKAFDAISYTTPGIYTYQLTETAGTVPGLTYDGTVRYVNVYVDNVTDADGTVTLNEDGTPWVTVTAITVWKGTNHTGTAADTTDKVTVSNSGTVTAPFTNTFGSTAESRLDVSKLVKGAAGNTNEQFTFQLQTSSTAALAYQVFNGTTAVTDAGKSGTIANNGTFTLKSGETVHIYGLKANDTYTVTEQGAADYRTSIAGSSGSTAAIAVAEDNKTVGQQTFQADKTDIQTFTNTKGATPPTGIVMDIMPFALLAGSAVLMAAVLIIRKFRAAQR